MAFKNSIDNLVNLRAKGFSADWCGGGKNFLLLNTLPCCWYTDKINTRRVREEERDRVRVHRKALSLQGKRTSLVEAILMSGSKLMWGVIVPTAVGHAWYQGCVGGENLGQLPLLWVYVVY